MKNILAALALIAAVGLVQGLVLPDPALAAETRIIARQVVVLERGADFIQTKVGVFRVNNATKVTTGIKRIKFTDLPTPCLAMIKYEPQDRSEPLLSEIEVVRALSKQDLRE